MAFIPPSGNKQLTTEQARSIPSVPAPSANPMVVTLQPTKIFTFFTQVVTNSQDVQKLYTGDRAWVTVEILLETAGPVVISDSQNMLPVLGGVGKRLITNVPYTVTIAKGTILYIASTSINRVGVTVQPLPWLEQITGILNALNVR